MQLAVPPVVPGRIMRPGSLRGRQTALCVYSTN